MLLQRSPIVARPVQRVAARRALVCKAQKTEESSPMKAVALPLASMVAAALIAGAAMPEDALAASSRSGGRVGGSSGFSARKSSAPSRSVQTQAARPTPPSSRSGGRVGRVGGSSGFAARKAPPARSIQTLAAPSVTNTTVVVASPPPVYSPFGFSPFGGFGFGFGMPVIVPVGGGFLSGLISLMFVTLLFSVVFNVIRGFMSQQNKEQQRKDDSWGDL